MARFWDRRARENAYFFINNTLALLDVRPAPREDETELGALLHDALERHTAAIGSLPTRPRTTAEPRHAECR